MNAATLWARTAVGALVDAGLREVCIAPGSRSTAMALAFAAHPGVRVYRQLDERSAGFFALGMALALERPVALLCTSGTATANFMPAIVEARMAQVPLLALTADRPPELRHSGANQTIDQVELYGKQVLWSVDLPLLEQDAPDVALRNLRATMARALATADGLVKGPVHLNFPFRKPFEPPVPALPASALPESAPAWSGAPGEAARTPQMVAGTMAPPEALLEELASLLAQHERGLIVCGPRCPGGDFPERVAQLARRSRYPLLADPLSGVRFGPWVAGTVVSGGYEGILAGGSKAWDAPQLVLRFGAVPTSKWLNDYLLQSAPPHVIHVRSSGVWADDSHRTSLFVQADEALTCAGLLERLPQRPQSPWQEAIARSEASYWQAIRQALAGDYFDGLAFTDLVDLLPDGALLFVGNSLPVRHLDQYGAPRRARLELFGNRGASGIDGNISSALGVAAARGQPVTAVLGDVTFYHDMNGLLAARDQQLDVTFLLMNNDGGSIFRRLPVASHDPPFTELFLTPHGLDFSHSARLYGFEHTVAGNRDELRRQLAQSAGQPGRRIVEFRSDGALDQRRRAALQVVIDEVMRQ